MGAIIRDMDEVLAALAQPAESSSVPFLIDRETRVAEAGQYRAALDRVLQPLLEARRDAGAFAVLKARKMSPLQTRLLRLVEPARVGGIESWNTELWPAIHEAEVELGLRVAALHLSGTAMLVVFGWAVAPDRALSDLETPGVALLFRLEPCEAAAGTCIVPWVGPDLPKQAPWHTLLKAVRVVSWAGAAVVPPSLYARDLVTPTHYFSLDKPFVQAQK